MGSHSLLLVLAASLGVVPERACLLLEFPASVTDAPGQELALDGLARGREPIPPVVLPLVRRQATVRELKPGAKKALVDAAEATLYILTLPIALANAGM